MPVVAVADDLRVLPPDDLGVGQEAAALGQVEYRSAYGGTPCFANTPLGIAQVNNAVISKVRVQSNVTESALAAEVDVRQSTHETGPRPVLCNDKKIALLLTDEHAAIGEERQSPRLVEGGHGFYVKRQIVLRANTPAQKQRRTECWQKSSFVFHPEIPCVYDPDSPSIRIPTEPDRSNKLFLLQQNAGAATSGRLPSRPSKTQSL